MFSYVGCISGAIATEDYRRELIAAGFSNVEVIDSGADLNAYAKIESPSGCCSPAPAQIEIQSGCCSPATTAAAGLQSVAQATATCCAPAPTSEAATDLFEQFTDLLRRYNVNEYAASVKVYAVK